MGRLFAAAKEVVDGEVVGLTRFKSASISSRVGKPRIMQAELACWRQLANSKQSRPARRK
jgi:hypothetical protein